MKPLLHQIPLTERPQVAQVSARPILAPVHLALFGLSMLMTGAVLLSFRPELLTQPARYGDFHTLALTHVFALGFATSVIIAVLYEFITPGLATSRRAQVVIGTYPLAVTLFVVALATGLTWVSAVAGPLLAIAIGIFLQQMFAPVMKIKRKTVVGKFHIAGFSALSLVIVLGALLATSLSSHWMGDPGRWLAGKIVLAVGGWLGMTIIGIFYPFIRVFNGSAVAPRFSSVTLFLAATGIGTTALLFFFNVGWLPRTVTMSLPLIAAILFFIDVLRTVKGRTNGAETVTWVGHVVAAAILVLTCIDGVLAMTLGVKWAAMATAGFLAGFVPISIVANGNVILPTLVAGRYGTAPLRLSVARPGSFLMPTAVILAVACWVSIEAGILLQEVVLIRVAAACLAGMAICLVASALSWLILRRLGLRPPEAARAQSPSAGSGSYPRKSE